MDQINYSGEHLWFGALGHGLVVLAFVTAILAAITYLISYKSRRDILISNQWKTFARNTYLLHAFSCISIFMLLLFMMANHYYEYQYVWMHVSEDLPMKYILSAFWEGQEGSFLLWILWHSVIGIVLLFKSKEWENTTMPVLCTVQAFLLCMLLGIHISLGDTVSKFGSSPFVLLRDVMEAPIFSRPDYLSVIKGKGMNVLLQNYWMTIHPPTLFLGFALTTFPFCFAVAGLITRKHKEWLTAVQPWALLAGSVLGTGILMGSAWAYEALSFNGYWAWDPVENMSLVPWIVLVAGIHTNMISKATGRSIVSTYWFYGSAFILILFSTFLTRSGVLGDTSAHAFTEMGLEWQLIIFLMTYLIGFTVLFFKRSKGISQVKTEEDVSSREFWMFIGSLVLIFSAVLITFTTSIPVYNKLLDFFAGIFNSNLTQYHRSAPLDVIGHYNKFQLWTAVFVAILSGFTYFLRYKESNFKSRYKTFFIRMGIFATLSLLLTFLASYQLDMVSWQYYIFFGAGVFTFLSNLTYFWIYLRKQPKFAGSVISHMGFGLMLVGILASGLNKRFISTNPFTQRGMIADEDLGKNVLLIKGSPMTMSGYEVNYKGDTIIDNNRTFDIRFSKLDEKGNKVKNFDLNPNIVYERDFSKVAASNPSTLRTLTKDIYVHIASLPPEEINQEQAKAKTDSLDFKPYKVNINDTLYTKRSYIKATGITFDPKHKEYKPEIGDIAIGLMLEVGNMKNDSVYKAMPVIVLRDEILMSYPAQINDLATKIDLDQNIFKPLFDKDDNQTFTIKVKPGDKFNIAGKELTFEKFVMKDKSGEKVVVSAEILNNQGNVVGSPQFEIIGQSSKSDKVYINELNAFIALVKIDPKDESATFEVNILKTLGKDIPIKVAENSTRADYIVLEAVVFPGINFFWFGSLMMMMGLGLGFWAKRKKQQKV